MAKSTNWTRFADDVLGILTRWEDDEARLQWKRGASVSYVLQLMRERGWVKIGDHYAFMDIVKNMGFKVSNLRKKDGTPLSGRYGITL